MANEDLIYRITRAVYSRMGPSTEEEAVELLVTDIYHEIAPFLGADEFTSSSSQWSTESVSANAREWSFRFSAWITRVSWLAFHRYLQRLNAVSSISIRQWCRASLPWSSSPIQHVPGRVQLN